MAFIWFVQHERILTAVDEVAYEISMYARQHCLYARQHRMYARQHCM